MHETDATDVPRLFYDGSCSLCRREIDHLRNRLVAHFTLVDISDSGFESWQGVGRLAMMKKIHVWTGVHFLVGLEASLYYWEKVGWTIPVSIIRLPGVHRLAGWAYDGWANWRFRKRAQCGVCSR
ncbi:thiol-disulfide oxidoreductase DCC family protein [Nitrincola alkalilacustris]|uniref:thiol-disulfide oxidoreductase DCC family protein n=1 Tax=Nitrincola alkalilacustris TaxID=1571224 RepID=UPI00124C4FB0|nr:DUF393 domain-containing protein [Nitrincola alkalilacustris]